MIQERRLQPRSPMVPLPSSTSIEAIARSLARSGPHPADARPWRIGPVCCPVFDLMENSGNYLLIGDLPGMEMEDLDINLAEHSITVTGERDFDLRLDTVHFYLLERCFGTFCRTFQVPRDGQVKHGRATMCNGVLTVAIPKRASLDLD